MTDSTAPRYRSLVRSISIMENTLQRKYTPRLDCTLTFSLDGIQTTAHNGTYYTSAYQVPRTYHRLRVLLISVYTASGLDDGPHTITLTNGDADRYLNLDYLVVNSTIQPGTQPAGTNVTAPDSRPPPKEEGAGSSAVIGAAVGGGVGLLLLGLLAWFLWRRRKQKRGESGYMDKPPLDLTGDEIRPFRDSTTPPADGPPLTQHPSATPTAESIYGQSHPAVTTSESIYVQGPGNASAPYLTMVPPPPPSSNTSYPPSSAGHARSPPVDPYATGLHRQDRSTNYTASEAGTFGPLPPMPDPSPITSSYKSLATAVPFTARRPSTMASSDEATLRTPSRMFVPGREMDAGPLSPTTQESHELEILPPDYHQATEPLPGQRPHPEV